MSMAMSGAVCVQIMTVYKSEVPLEPEFTKSSKGTKTGYFIKCMEIRKVEPFVFCNHID